MINPFLTKMRLKRRNVLSAFGIYGASLCALLIGCVPQSEGTIDPRNHAGLTYSWIGLSSLMFTILAGIQGIQSGSSDVPLTIVNSSQTAQIPLQNVTISLSHINYTNSSPNKVTSINADSSNQPRRVNKLPRSHSHSSHSRRSRLNSNVPESARSRARTLLGSLNRNNCFAKVLCGLGAKPPSTKTALANDYVYLMEELLVDEDDDEPSGSKKKTWGKGGKGKKTKIHSKKDDSDSSQSEESKEDNEKDPELGWLADEELAGEDPAILRYVKLEQRRRKLKTEGKLSKRRSRFGQIANGTDAPIISQGNPNADNNTMITSRPSMRMLDVKKTRKLTRHLETAVKAGRTFGGSRQCRTFSTQCPFDDKQMNEIVKNLKIMMMGQANNLARLPSTTSGVSNGAANTVLNPGSPASKVEIVLHLNQNGVPYQGTYPMPYPGTITPNPAGIPVQPQQFIYPGYTPQQQPVYMPITSPPLPTTTTPEPTTTVRSVGEEQLLDFLYGVVNFNDTEKESSLKPIERNPNPFWEMTNRPNYIEKPLKQKKQKPPSWGLNDDDDDDESKSSEELKQYLFSLRETLEGLAQMNNVTLAVDQKVVKSSEERESSQEDTLDDGGFPVPGFETDEEDDEEDDNHAPTDKEVKLKVKGKNKKRGSGSKAPVIASTKLKPKTNQTGSEPLFDDDNQDNGETQTNLKQPPSKQSSKNRPPKRRQPQQENNQEEDDEDEPEGSDDENDDENTEEQNYKKSEQMNEEDENTDEQNYKKSEQMNDDDENEDSGVNEESNKKKEKPPRKKITLKFESSGPGRDPYEMSDQEKHNLAALSNVLMQTPSGPPIPPPHKRKPDVLEEIRLPLIQPVMKEFQSVSDLAQDTAVINIDEFAEHSGINPVFPKKNKNRPRRPYRNYQNRRKAPVVRPMMRQNDQSNSKPDTSEEDEHDNEEDEESGPSSRAESIKRTPPSQTHSISKTASHNSVKKTKLPKQKPELKRNRNRYQSPSPNVRQDFANRNSGKPLIAVPYEPTYPQPFHTQEDNQHGNYDFLSNVFNIMGLRSIGDSGEGPPGQRYYPTGPKDEMSNVRPYYMDFGHQGESEKSRHINKHNRGRTDFPGSVEDSRRPQPKIAISIPFDEFQGGRQDDLQDDKGGKKKAGDKKGKGGDKKGKGKGKKKDKKKNKKKGGKGSGEQGFSTQFHQQVYPAPEKDPGIWDTIKGYIDKLGTGDTPFIQVGFSEEDPLPEEPVHGPVHDHGPGPNHGPVFHQDLGSDEHSDEEEDEEEEEEDDIGDSVEFDDLKPTKFTNKFPNNSTSFVERNSDEQPVAVPPKPTTTLIPEIKTVAPTSVILPLPTTKSTIAPKPPKYKVNQIRIRNKKKRKGNTGSTTGQPISLFRITTIPPPTTRMTTTPVPCSKPPKKKIMYKSGGKRVLSPPGSIVQYITTVIPRVVGKPVEHDKDSGEDDEIEPSSVFFQPGPNGQNIRGRPPIPIDAFHTESEDMFDSGEQRMRSDVPHFRQRPRPLQGPSSDEEQSPITTAVMNSPIFSNHFKHLYTKFQSFGNYFNPSFRNSG